MQYGGKETYPLYFNAFSYVFKHAATYKLKPVKSITADAPEEKN